MSIKEQVLQGLDTLSDAELVQVAEFVAFLKFRARLAPLPTLDAAQLAALYAAGGEEDRALAEAGLVDYVQELRHEDAS
jgi:hypothetical protein